MIAIVLWILIGGLWVNYRVVRAVFVLILRLFLLKERMRNKVAGALTLAFWLACVWVIFIGLQVPIWTHLAAAALSVWLFVAVVRMEGRRPVRLQGRRAPIRR